MLTNDGKLDALIRDAMTKFNGLSAEEKRDHRRAQAISWVYGEMCLSRTDPDDPITREEENAMKEQIADIYDRRNAEQKDIDEIRTLHAECAAIVIDERKPGRVAIGLCPAQLDDGFCRAPLTASAASHRVRCSACGGRWETLGEWRELRAAQEHVLAEAAGVAA